MHYPYVAEITPTGGPDFPPQSEGNLHVVDVGTGTDRMVLKGATYALTTGQTYAVWGVVQYVAEGVYIEKQAYQSEGLRGLWLVNPDTGSSRQVLPETVRDFSFGSGAAWVGNGSYDNTTMYRIDLATGARTEWFSKPSPFVWFKGSDASGRPLMMWQQGTPAASEVWALSRPSQGSQVYSGPQSTMPFPPGPNDSHGIWFGSLDGASVLWLLDINDKLIKVAGSPVQPLGSCQ